MPNATPEMREWFAEFAEQNYAYVLRLCCYLCKQSSLGISYADDLAQDVFLIARKRVALLMKHPNPKAWLYQSATYAFNNAARKAQRRGRFSAFSLDAGETPGIEGKAIEQPIFSSFLRSQREEIVAAVRTLNAKDRLLFEQIYRMGMSRKDLQEEYGLSEQAMNKRIQRMHARLRQKMEQNFSN